jgi:hypothetical protein
MNDKQLDRVAEIVQARVERQLKEFANLVESEGATFAIAVIVSSCAEIAGAAIASHSDPDIRDAGQLAFSLAMMHSVEKHQIRYAALEAIEKAKA